MRDKKRKPPAHVVILDMLKYELQRARDISEVGPKTKLTQQFSDVRLLLIALGRMFIPKRSKAKVMRGLQRLKSMCTPKMHQGNEMLEVAIKRIEEDY